MAKSSKKRKFRRWLAEEIALLGSNTDQAIAQQIGRTASDVCQKRHRLGIAAFGPSTAERRHQWTRRELAWLGKKSDAEIGRLLHLDGTTVAAKRESLGIENPRSKTTGHRARVWSQRELNWLGKVPDSVIAKRMKIRRRKVIAKRQMLGIENPVVAKSKAKWTPAIVRLLGTMQDVDLAKKTGISVSSIRGRRLRQGIAAYRKPDPLTPALVKQLGKKSDQQIGQLTGLSARRIAERRRELGIHLTTTR